MRAVYRFMVCCLLGFAAALASALVAAVLAVVFYGSIGQALDPKSSGMPGVMMAQTSAVASAQLAGFVCGLVCMFLRHGAFRRVQLRVVLPACLLSALCGAVGGAVAGTLFDPRNPRDESYIEVWFWAGLASVFIGPLIAWLADRSLRGNNSESAKN